jgi:hypothetical protein
VAHVSADIIRAVADGVTRFVERTHDRPRRANSYRRSSILSVRRMRLSGSSRHGTSLCDALSRGPRRVL